MDETLLDMRLRIRELMAGHNPPLSTAYALEKASREKSARIPMSTAHRLVSTKGKPDRVDLRTLDALCDVFGVEPGDLWERDKKRR